MTSSPETRFSLIGKLGDSRDVEAWAEFTDIYQPLIFRVCLSKGLQHADATDVTQEVLTKVASAIGNFDKQGNNVTFRGWLFRVTRNLVVDFFRHRNKDKLVQADPLLMLGVEAKPNSEASDLFQLEYRRQMFWVLAQEIQTQVQPVTWQAFWQTEVEQRSVDEVAAELNLKRGSIYMARSRVLARMKNAVQKRMNEL